MFQVWSDFQKVRRKVSDSKSSFPARFHFVLYAWVALPPIFLLVLLSPLLPERMESAELPLLLLLPLLAAGIEAIFMHATSDAIERYEWRKHLVLRLMGASVMYLGAVAVALRIGNTSLAGISALQAGFPYHAIISSPGLFCCGVGGFAAIFLFAAESPIQNRDELSLNRSMQYLLFFVNKMWIFCLLCFWVFVFLGGAGTILAKIIFPFKALLALAFFSLLQVSFPRVRSSDAIELTARWLLRLCLIGIFLEAIWVGVWG